MANLILATHRCFPTNKLPSLLDMFGKLVDITIHHSIFLTILGTETSENSVDVEVRCVAVELFCLLIKICLRHKLTKKDIRVFEKYRPELIQNCLIIIKCLVRDTKEYRATDGNNNSGRRQIEFMYNSIQLQSRTGGMFICYIIVSSNIFILLL